MSIKHFTGKDGAKYNVPEEELKDFILSVGNSGINVTKDEEPKKKPRRFRNEKGEVFQVPEDELGDFAKAVERDGMNVVEIENLGIGPTIWKTQEARYGEMTGPEMAASFVPFLGDAIQRTKETRERRLYFGDFNNTLEGGKIASAMGMPQEQLNKIYEETGIGPKNRLGGYNQYNMELFKQRMREYAEPILKKRVETRQKAQEDLSRNDLNTAEEIITAIPGITRIATMMNSVAAGVTLPMDAVTRGAELAASELTTDENGKIVVEKSGDDDGVALAKGIAGATAERAIWMYLDKFAKILGGKLLKKFPVIDKALGKILGRGMEVKANVFQKLGKNAAGRVVLKTGEILKAIDEKTHTGSLVNMMFKSRVTELADNVMGFNVKDSADREAFLEWAEKFISAKEYRDLFVEMIGIHLLMVGYSGVKAYGKERAFRKEAARTLDEYLGPEQLKKLSNEDVSMLTRLVNASKFSAEAAEQFLDQIKADYAAAKEKVEKGESYLDIKEGLEGMRQTSEGAIKTGEEIIGKTKEAESMQAAEEVQPQMDEQTAVKKEAARQTVDENLEGAEEESREEIAERMMAKMTEDVNIEDPNERMRMMSEVLDELLEEETRETVEQSAEEIAREKMTREIRAQEENLKEPEVAEGEKIVEEDEGKPESRYDNREERETQEEKKVQEESDKAKEVTGDESNATMPVEREDGSMGKLPEVAKEIAGKKVEPARIEDIKSPRSIEEAATIGAEMPSARLTTKADGTLKSDIMPAIKGRMNGKRLEIEGLQVEDFTDPSKLKNTAALLVHLVEESQAKGYKIAFTGENAAEITDLAQNVYAQIVERGFDMVNTFNELHRMFALEHLVKSGLGTGFEVGAEAFKNAVNSDPNGKMMSSGFRPTGYVGSDGKVYINPVYFELDVPIHEYGHLAIEALRKLNPALLEQGFEMLRNSPEGQAEIVRISKMQEYHHLTREGLLEEALNKFIERAGKGMLQRGEDIRAWTNALWKNLGSEWGLKGLNSNEISSLSVGEVADIIAAEMLEGGISGRRFGETKDLWGSRTVTNDESKPFEFDFPPVVVHTTRAKTKKSKRLTKLFESAKQGSMRDALTYTASLFDIALAKGLKFRHPNAWIVPIIAEEAEGRNRIPLALAMQISKVTGLGLTKDIVQTSIGKRRGKGLLEHLTTPVSFAGKVRKGQEYIIIDDHNTSGTTFQAMRTFIEANGGKVVECMALTQGSRGLEAGHDFGILQIAKDQVKQIRENYKEYDLDEALKRKGIAGGIEALTRTQAAIILRSTRRAVVEGLGLDEGRGGADSEVRAGRREGSDGRGLSVDEAAARVTELVTPELEEGSARGEIAAERLGRFAIESELSDDFEARERINDKIAREKESAKLEEEMSKSELNERTKNGDPAALNEFVRRYHNRLVQWVYGSLSKRMLKLEVAEEIVQNMWLEATKKFLDGGAPKEFGITTFVSNALKWAVSNEFKRKKLSGRESVSLDSTFDDGEETQNALIDRVAQGEQTLSGEMVSEETGTRQEEKAAAADKLSEILKFFPEQHQRIFRARGVEMKEFSTIAKELGMPITKVESIFKGMMREIRSGEYKNRTPASVPSKNNAVEPEASERDYASYEEKIRSLIVGDKFYVSDELTTEEVRSLNNTQLELIDIAKTSKNLTEFKKEASKYFRVSLVQIDKACDQIEKSLGRRVFEWINSKMANVNAKGVETRRRILELVEAGKTSKEIADEMNISMVYVTRLRKELGIKEEKPEQGGEKANKIIELLKQGVHASEIKEILDVTKEYVSRIAVENNLGAKGQTSVRFRKLIQALREGATIKQAAEKSGYTAESASVMLKRAGVDAKSFDYKKKRIEKVIERIKEGESLEAVAKEQNLNTRYLFNMLRAENVDVRIIIREKDKALVEAVKEGAKRGLTTSEIEKEIGTYRNCIRGLQAKYALFDDMSFSSREDVKARTEVIKKAIEKIKRDGLALTSMRVSSLTGIKNEVVESDMRRAGIAEEGASEEMKKNAKEILHSIKVGKSEKEIAESMGFTETQLKAIAEKYGLDLERELNEAKKSKIQDLLKTGKSYEEIYEETGLTKEAIIKFAHANGFSVNDFKSEVGDRSKLFLDLYNKGLSKTDIAIVMQMYPGQIDKIAKRVGVEFVAGGKFDIGSPESVFNREEIEEAKKTFFLKREGEKSFDYPNFSGEYQRAGRIVLAERGITGLTPSLGRGTPEHLRMKGPGWALNFKRKEAIKAAKMTREDLPRICSDKELQARIDQKYVNTYRIRTDKGLVWPRIENLMIGRRFEIPAKWFTGKHTKNQRLHFLKPENQLANEAVAAWGSIILEEFNYSRKDVVEALELFVPSDIMENLAKVAKNAGANAVYRPSHWPTYADEWIARKVAEIACEGRMSEEGDIGIWFWPPKNAGLVKANYCAFIKKDQSNSLVGKGVQVKNGQLVSAGGKVDEWLANQIRFLEEIDIDPKKLRGLPGYEEALKLYARGGQNIGAWAETRKLATAAAELTEAERYGKLSAVNSEGGINETESRGSSVLGTSEGSPEGRAGEGDNAIYNGADTPGEIEAARGRNSESSGPVGIESAGRFSVDTFGGVFEARPDRHIADAEEEWNPGGISYAIEQKEAIRPWTAPYSPAANAQPIAFDQADLVRFYRKITGVKRPPLVVEKATGEMGGMQIAAKIFGVLDKSDVAMVKESLKEDGYFLNEDPEYADRMTAQELMDDSIRSQKALENGLEKLYEHKVRTGEGGEHAATHVLAHEIGQVILDMPQNSATGIIMGNAKRLLNALIRAVKKDGSIADEMNELVAWWHGQEKCPEYYKGNRLAAEVFGIMLTQPEQVNDRAPKVYKAFQKTIAENEVLSKAYRDFCRAKWDGSADDMLLEDLEKTWDEEMAKRIRSLEEKADEVSWNWKDDFNYALNDRFGPMFSLTERGLKKKKQKWLELEKAGRMTPEMRELLEKQADQIRLNLKSRLYDYQRAIGGEVRMMVYGFNEVIEKAKKANVNWYAVRRYAHLMRIIELGGRATAHAITPMRAAKLLETMRERLGETEFSKVEAVAREFRAVYEREIIDNADVQAMFDGKTNAMLRRNKHYVSLKHTLTAEEVEMYEKEIEAWKAEAGEKDPTLDLWIRLHKGLKLDESGRYGYKLTPLIGSFDATKDPIAETIRKAIEIRLASKRNALIKTLAGVLQEAGVRDVFLDSSKPIFNNRFGTLIYMDRGKTQKLVVPRIIEKCFNTEGSLSVLPGIQESMRALRHTMTIWNPSFINRAWLLDKSALETNIKGLHKAPVDVIAEALMLKIPFTRVQLGVPLYAANNYLSRFTDFTKTWIGQVMYGPHTVNHYARQAQKIARIVYESRFEEEVEKAKELREVGRTSEAAEIEENVLIAREMLKRNVFQSQYEFNAVQKATSTEGIMRAFNIGTNMERELAGMAKGKEAAKAAGRAWNRYGEEQEAVSKIIAWLYDKKQHPDGDAAARARLAIEQGGTPNLNARGILASWIENATGFFWNVRKEGTLRSFRAFKDHPTEWAVKATVQTLIPQFMKGLAVTGTLAAIIKKVLFDDDEEKMNASALAPIIQYYEWMGKAMRNVPAYEQRNYNVIPLAINTNGTGTFGMRIKWSPEEFAIVNAVHAAMQKIGENPTDPSADASTALNGAILEFLPNFEGVNPVSAWTWALLAPWLGINPYDSFRARNLYTDDAMLARWLKPKYIGKEMMVNAVNYSPIGSLVMAVDNKRDVAEDAKAPDEVDMLLNGMPVLSRVARSCVGYWSAPEQSGAIAGLKQVDRERTAATRLEASDILARMMERDQLTGLNEAVAEVCGEVDARKRSEIFRLVIAGWRSYCRLKHSSQQYRMKKEAKRIKDPSLKAKAYEYIMDAIRNDD